MGTELREVISISGVWVCNKGITGDNKESFGSLEYFTVNND